MENNMFLIIRKAARAIRTSFRLDAEHTLPQYLVLAELAEQDNRRILDVGDAIGMDRSTIGPVIKRLEAAGAVTVGKDPNDGRAKCVSLTSEGRRLVRRLERRAEKLGAKLLPNENAARQVVEALSELISKAEAQAAKDAKAKEAAKEKVSE